MPLQVCALTRGFFYLMQRVLSSGLCPRNYDDVLVWAISELQGDSMYYGNISLGVEELSRVSPNRIGDYGLLGY